MGAAWSLEIRMVRCFSLLGMVAFALGVVALAAVSRKAAAIPAPQRGPLPAPAGDKPRLSVFPALAFHAPFSLN
jgi:hypothetical protein